MKLSACNQLPCSIVAIKLGQTTAHVTIDVDDNVSAVIKFSDILVGK